MVRHRLAFTVLVSALAAGCARTVREIPLLSGSRVNDAAAIAAVLDDVHRGMESQRIYTVLAHVSRNYYDSEGRDYAAMEVYLNEIFRRYRIIRINRERPRILVENDRARALETFATIAEPTPGPEGRPFTVRGQVTVYLEKVGDRWLITEWGHLL